MSKKQLTENQIKQIIREEFAEKGVTLTEEEINELLGFGEKGKLIKSIQQRAEEHPEELDKLGYAVDGLKGLPIKMLQKIDFDLQTAIMGSIEGEPGAAGEKAALAAHGARWAGKEKAGFETGFADLAEPEEEEKKSGFSETMKGQFIETMIMRLNQDKQFAPLKKRFPGLARRIWVPLVREIERARPELRGALEETFKAKPELAGVLQEQWTTRSSLAPAGRSSGGDSFRSYRDGKPSLTTKQKDKEHWRASQAQGKVIGLSTDKMFVNLNKKIVAAHGQAIINALQRTLNDVAGGVAYFLVVPGNPAAALRAEKLTNYDDAFAAMSIAAPAPESEAAPEDAAATAGPPAQRGLAAALGDVPEPEALEADLAAQAAKDKKPAGRPRDPSGEADVLSVRSKDLPRSLRGKAPPGGRVPAAVQRAIGVGQKAAETRAALGAEAPPKRKKRKAPAAPTRPPAQTDRGRLGSARRKFAGGLEENQEAPEEDSLLNEQKELERWKKLANISDEKD